MKRASLAEFFITPIGRSLGDERVEVSDLFDQYGPVRTGLAEKTGFSRVHHLVDGVTLAEFAVSALSNTARVFLQAQCDQVIVVSSSSQDVTPGIGSEIHELLALSPSCSVVNINDACTGFNTGLQMARLLLQDGAVKTVLLITVDGYSRFFPDSDLTVSPLFSDGTAAFLISRSSPDLPASDYPSTAFALIGRVTETAGSLRELLTISSRDDRSDSSAPTPTLRMRGGEVFSFVAGRFPRLVAELKAQIGAEELERVSWFVHQGSRLVVNHVGSVLGQDEDSLFRAKDYGNVVSSSIPFQLQDNWDQVRQAHLIGLVSFGVGMVISVIVLSVGRD